MLSAIYLCISATSYFLHLYTGTLLFFIQLALTQTGVVAHKKKQIVKRQIIYKRKYKYKIST